MGTNRFDTPRGPSQRQLRVGELIRRNVSEVLSRGDVHDPELTRWVITVSEVRMSTDLKVATAYIMPLGGKGQKEALLALRRNKAELRHQMARDMTLKYLPDLRFQLDESFDRMEETRRLLQDERVQRDVANGREDDEPEA